MTQKMLLLPLACTCGAVRGHLEVRERAVTRCVCFCRDCRAFAHALDRAADVLDARGGTEVIQMVPGSLHFSQGHEQIALMQLSEGGLFRWHTSCCRAPIGNTLRTTRFPFIGVIDSLLTAEARQELHGRVPLHAHVYTQFALDAPSSEPRRERSDEPPLGGTGLVLRRFARIVMTAWFDRDARRTPLFDDAGRPVCPPEVLDPEERARIAAIG